MDSHKTIRRIFHFNDCAYQAIPWGSSQKYGRDLFPVLFAKLGFNVGAEIGVRRARFSVKLCKANPKLKLYCIDPWAAYGRYTQEKQDSILELAKKNLDGYSASIIRKPSMEALADIEDESLDFCCIDGEHTFDYCCPDIIYWSKKVRTGGIITVHDYHYGRNVQVVEAVNAYTRAHHIDPWYVTKETQPTAYWVKQ